MTRAELMCRMTSLELSAWMALSRVRAEEEQEARDLAESGDGVVTGDPTLADDDEDDEPEDLDDDERMD